MTRIRRVADVVARLVPHRWRWAEANAERIATHWMHRKAQRPEIFNGRVLMLAELRTEGQSCDARFFETDYAVLTAWLDLGRPDETVGNAFAMGALCGNDGGFILGRMADHTANAGQLYFPAGTPDLSDVTPTGEVDLAASLEREIAEETGLGSSDWEIARDWTIVEAEGRIAFLRLVRLRESAEVSRTRIRRFLASETRPELADVIVVSSEADLDPIAMPAFQTAFLKAVWSDQSA